jgi:hypothetical protein
MLSAAPSDGLDAFHIPSLLSVGTVFGLLFGYGLGFVHAVWRRARKDYDTTKGAVPKLRKTKWEAWRTMVQRGTLVVAAVTGLIVWLFISATEGGAAP